MYCLLVELGIQCEVVAPTLVPVKAGDLVSRLLLGSNKERG